MTLTSRQARKAHQQVAIFLLVFLAVHLATHFSALLGHKHMTQL